MIDPLTFELCERLGASLRRAGLRLATAESCTGGGLGYAVTAVAGSSEWYERGFITYSNAAKEDLLGVPADILARFGAVSVETAAAMAQGALRQSPAHLSVAVTGVAGPGGGAPDKPVGTVCFAWHRRDGDTRTARHVFAGDRGEIRDQSILAALQGLLDLVQTEGEA